jgi:hypothetical protein
MKIVQRPAGAECAAILASLPEWFSIPASNAAYAERAGSQGAWLAMIESEAVGIMILEPHGESAVESIFSPSARRRIAMASAAPSSRKPSPNAARAAPLT